jgi:hypothetical protein
VNKYLLSEGDVLRKIKKLQYRAQILPLIAIAVSFWTTITFGHITLLRMVFMGITIAGLIGFFITALRFRYRNRIIMPDSDSIYVPISGKVQDQKIIGQRMLINIHKHSYDPVEIRCPHDDCVWEAGELLLRHPEMRISFSSMRMIRISEARMKAGEVVALMIGKGSCQIELPAALPILLKQDAVCQAGESRICVLEEIEQS